MTDAAARKKVETRDQRRDRRAANNRRCGHLPLHQRTWETLANITGPDWEKKRDQGYHEAMDAYAELIDQAVSALAEKISTRGNASSSHMRLLDDNDVKALTIGMPEEDEKDDNDDDE